MLLNRGDLVDVWIHAHVSQFDVGNICCVLMYKTELNLIG